MLRKILGGFYFVLIWCLFCFLQENYFLIETDAYLMAYGFAVGSVSSLIQRIIEIN